MGARAEIRILVEKAQRGDAAAANALIEACEDRLGAFVQTRLGHHLRNRIEVEDTVQETLLRALRSLDRFQWQGEESFFNWLCSIAEFYLRDVARRRPDQQALPLECDVPASDVSPSQSMRRDERFDRLKECLETLSPEYREVVHLVCLQGLRVKEAAERLGKSPGAVRNIFLRAIRKLRGTFGETESLHLPDRNLETGGADDDR